MTKYIVSSLLIVLGLITYVQADSKAKASDMQAHRAMNTSDAQSIAIFAGGCFWCVEKDLEKLPGVSDAVSGYIDGHAKNPTYKQVSRGNTGHIEAVEVHFDPSVTSYEDLLLVFWRHIDPTDAGGQFVDRGHQYSTAIFYLNEDQKQLAEASKKALIESGRFKRDIVTPIKAASKFYVAEEFHQDYYKKNPVRYAYYRHASGRDKFIEQYWTEEELAQLAVEPSQKGSNAQANAMTYEKPSIDVLKKTLTPLQFDVTQEDGTEPPFQNAYWDEKREGIYVDIVSGEPLFSSKDKYKSGTGWPSFTRPIFADHVVEKTDYKLFLPRTEVRSKYGDSHLGHVFKDGPAPTGLRYCINSAALRFIPKESLKQEGYGHLTAHL